MEGRRTFLKALASGLAVSLFGTTAAKDAFSKEGPMGLNGASIDPKLALRLLKEGNKRFVRGIGLPAPSRDILKRFKLERGPRPFAAIISCSDPRVVPELVFNQTIGKLVVIRNSGNLVDPFVLGSVEEAVSRMGVSLVLILSHDGCHAVEAAVRRFERRGTIEPQWVGSVLTGIMPAVTMTKKKTGQFGSRLSQVATRENARLQANRLMEMSKFVREKVEKGQLLVTSAHYNLETGMVHFNI